MQEHSKKKTKGVYRKDRAHPSAAREDSTAGGKVRTENLSQTSWHPVSKVSFATTSATELASLVAQVKD